ncbi:hypothetical protein GCM10009799_33510 [Nocardiopsis rhodophaea]|uniref:Uncharacterized protein n=1 Tax=Nocardiopsis rhodophaea TaxID=280238 RepID=A0ABN2TCQ8_9ACTN
MSTVATASLVALGLATAPAAVANATADPRPIFKGTWNLESWRPNVGLAKTMAKKCNPYAEITCEQSGDGDE